MKWRTLNFNLLVSFFSPSPIFISPTGKSFFFISWNFYFKIPAATADFPHVAPKNLFPLSFKKKKSLRWRCDKIHFHRVWLTFCLYHSTTTHRIFYFLKLFSLAFLLSQHSSFLFFFFPFDFFKIFIAPCHFPLVCQSRVFFFILSFFFGNYGKVETFDAGF